MLTLMPEVGQLTSVLAVLTITLFSWRILGIAGPGFSAARLRGLFASSRSFMSTGAGIPRGLAWLYCLCAGCFSLMR